MTLFGRGLDVFFDVLTNSRVSNISISVVIISEYIFFLVNSFISEFINIDAAVSK